VIFQALILCFTALFALNAEATATSNNALKNEPSQTDAPDVRLREARQETQEQHIAEPMKPFIWFPIAYYTPETKIAAGVLSLFNFKEVAIGKTSSAMLMASYTQNKQTIIAFDPRIYFDGGKKEIFFSAFYSFYPSKYYGRLDSGTTISVPEPFKENNFNLQLNYSNNIWSDLYTRWFIGRDKRKIIEYLPTGLVAQDVANGFSDFLISSGGLSLEWDNRDYPQAPLQGAFHRMTLTHYQADGTLRERPFKKFDIEAKNYHSLGDRRVFATQVLLSRLDGDEIPFHYLGSVGGNRRLRGFYAGRYRNLSSGLVQLEWRKDYSKNFSAALFGGIGRLGLEPGDLLEAESHVAGGVGVHYIMDPKNRTKIRLDLGYSKEGMSVYFVTGEAF
jgi:hypothetical protein